MALQRRSSGNHARTLGLTPDQGHEVLEKTHFLDVVANPGPPHRLRKDQASDRGIQGVTDDGRMESDDQGRPVARALGTDAEIVSETAGELTENPLLKRYAGVIKAGDILHHVHQVMHVLAKSFDNVKPRAGFRDAIRSGACERPVNMVVWMPGMVSGHSDAPYIHVTADLCEPPAQVVRRKPGQIGMCNLHDKPTLFISSERVNRGVHRTHRPGENPPGGEIPPVRDH